MKHSDVVCWHLVPAYENAAEAVHPTVCPFDDLAACPFPHRAFDLLGLLTSCLDVSREAELRDHVSDFFVVVALVQAQSLLPFHGRTGAIDRDALQGLPYQLHVVAVGARNHQADGHALGFDQQTAFDPPFGPIRGVLACLVASKGALVMHPSMLSQRQSMPLK